MFLTIRIRQGKSLHRLCMGLPSHIPRCKDLLQLSLLSVFLYVSQTLLESRSISFQNHNPIHQLSSLNNRIHSLRTSLHFQSTHSYIFNYVSTNHSHVHSKYKQIKTLTQATNLRILNLRTFVQTPLNFHSVQTKKRPKRFASNQGGAQRPYVT